MRRQTTITAITVIALALVALQFWNSQRSTTDHGPLPVLTRGLPKDTVQGRRVFDERVQRRFPPGTPDADVVKELTAEGFHIENAGAWRAAELKRMVFPCSVAWRVRWRLDAMKKVTETKGFYGLSCP